MRIEKKILPEYFDLILSGKKTYDLRLADFSVSEGDILVLKEWDADARKYTGREIKKVVTYVGRTKGDTNWDAADIEKYGYQIISFKSE